MKNLWDDLLGELLKAERAQDSRPVATGYFGTSSPSWMKKEVQEEGLSVEAKVRAIRERVRLDNIQKEASEKFPLFLRKGNSGVAAPADSAPDKSDAAKTTPDDIVDLVAYTKALVESRRGHIDVPAVIFELKKMFPEDLVRNNVEYLQEVAAKARQRYESNRSVRMPTSIGQVSETLEAEDKKLFPIITDTLKQM